MKVAVIAKLRHGELIEWRRALGISGAEAARRAGVSIGLWCKLETMQFDRVSRNGTAIERIMSLTGLSREQIIPAELATWKLSNGERVAYAEVEHKALVAYARQTKDRLALPCVSTDEMDRQNIVDKIARSLGSFDSRLATILKMRYGLSGSREHSYGELAKLFKLTRWRIRQLEAEGLRELSMSGDANELREWIEEK